MPGLAGRRGPFAKAQRVWGSSVPSAPGRVDTTMDDARGWGPWAPWSGPGCARSGGPTPAAALRGSHHGVAGPSLTLSRDAGVDARTHSLLARPHRLPPPVTPATLLPFAASTLNRFFFLFEVW